MERVTPRPEPQGQPERGGGQGRRGAAAWGRRAGPCPQHLAVSGGCEEVWGGPSLGPNELLGLCLRVPRWQVRGWQVWGAPGKVWGSLNSVPVDSVCPGLRWGRGERRGLQLPPDSPRGRDPSSPERGPGCLQPCRPIVLSATAPVIAITSSHPSERRERTRIRCLARNLCFLSARKQEVSGGGGWGDARTIGAPPEGKGNCVRAAGGAGGGA